MKIRFSKTLAAILAATTVTAISGISALAATSVITTTTYDWTNKGVSSTNVTVTSVVEDAEKIGAQVTYLVATSTPSVEGAIKYIDQAPIGDDGKATFTFTAPQSTIYDTEISAKYGSDASLTLPTFKFVEGADYLTNGTATCTSVAEMPNVVGSGLFYGKVSGEVTGDYGITLTKDGETYYLPAKGTVAGVFCIKIEGFDATGYEVGYYTVPAAE